MELDIFDGDFTVIMGASGSGKSTLLYALSEAELTDTVKNTLDNNNAVLRWRADERIAVNGKAEMFT